MSDFNSQAKDHKTIRPLTNYVLIKPDEEQQKYHLDGKETSIYVGTSYMKYVDPEDSIDFDTEETVDTQAHHWPITGEVIAIPSKMNFAGNEISRFRRWLSDDSITPDDLRHMRTITRSSLKVDTECEVEVGDRVIFDYLVNINSYDTGMYIHTDIGTLFLVRYDELIGKITQGGAYPLNDNIFFKWEQSLQKNGIDLIEKEIEDAIGVQEGVVTHVGKTIPRKLEGSSLVEDYEEYMAGDKFLFESHFASKIESPFHLSIFDGDVIYTISRQNILLSMSLLKSI